MKKVLLLLSASVLSASASASLSAPEIIYGEDNRVDVYESTSPAFVELSKSTAAMITKKRNIVRERKWFRSTYHVNPMKLRQKQRTCPGERFENQPSAASCSGFLVGPKHIVTAGHCIKTKEDCKNNLWVFDYKMQGEKQANLSFSSENVYSCKRVISQQLNPETDNDYALIELKRRVVGRKPLKFRKSGKPAVGDELVVIGHPSGLPTKIADGAKIRTIGKNTFRANLDTYGGNSGSAVFNATTKEVEGILVNGDQDYIDLFGLCNMSNVVEDYEGRGEGVTLIGTVKGLKNL